MKTTTLHRVDSVAIIIEDYSMDIDLKPLPIGENERVRWCTVLDCEAPATEDISQPWYVGDGDNNVDKKALD
jgi:hypothetical protein